MRYKVCIYYIFSRRQKTKQPKMTLASNNAVKPMLSSHIQLHKLLLRQPYDSLAKKTSVPALWFCVGLMV